MRKPTTLLFTLLASLSLTGSPAWAQSPEAAAKPKPAKFEAAPNVRNFKDLQKLNRQIVSLSKEAQPATVCLIAKNGRGSGSGVVVSEEGLILTAAHVTSGMKEGVVVIFPDGTRRSGVALGADYDRDAAMVKINEPGKYPFVEVGQSKDLKRNQWTVALGHSGGFDPMRKPPVRLGRVLANQNFIVSDTAVVGGDSGGPLFDVQGKVIGIHSNIGRTLMENRHVPIEVFHRQWDDLKSGQTSGRRFDSAQQNAPSPDQPVLGIQLADSDEGVRVEGVVPKSPAEKAGLKVGDVIKKLNGEVVKTTAELIKTVKGKKAGDEVAVDFHRDGKPQSVKAKLTSFKDLSGQGQAPKKEEQPKKQQDEGQKKKPAPKKEQKEAKKPGKKPAPKKEQAKEDELDKLIDGILKGEGKVRELKLTPEQLEKFGGMEKLTKRLQERMGKKLNSGAAQKKEGKEEKKAESKKAEPKKPEAKKAESKKKPAPKKEEPKKEKVAPKKDAGKIIDDLLEKAAKNGGRLEMTPDLLEKMGGMEEFMKELQKRGGMGRVLPQGPDTFFESSLKALAPVAKKNEGSTVLVLNDGKPAALGTVISANGRILTKDTETGKGKLSVRVGEKNYEAMVLKRFPNRDLALLKIAAEGLRPVRFQATEPPLGSILTATGAMNEPLGIGLLSVPGRAMAKVGFIGIQAGESDHGVLIEKIVPNGAAVEAGLKDKDVITKFDGNKVDDPVEFGHLIRGRKAGETMEVEYLRDGKAGKVTVTLKERAMRDNVQNDPRMKRTLGELSQKTSGYPDAIQHDIPLPPQLCGGPLFDLRGRCIGVNVSRAGRTKTYAIPADEIQEMLKIVKEPKPVEKQPKETKPAPKNETLEAIKAIRESLKQIEKRLDELEKAER